MKPEVLVDMDRRRFHDAAIQMLSPVADPHFQRLTPEFVAEHRDAAALILAGRFRVDKELLQTTPRLKIAARFGVGYNNVDVEACTRRGVYVTITPDVLSGAVADITMGLMLCLIRHVLEADRYVRREWARGTEAHLQGVDLEGKSLGIVGLGRIGFQVAKRARGFGMSILYYDALGREEAERRFGAKRLPLEELLGEADIVTLHVPLNEGTRGLIGRRELSLMRETAYLINTSRGAVVDQDALVEFLREGRIAGAGLDVFQQEPVPLDDPILQLDNAVLTPHMGSATTEARRRMAVTAAENVLRVLRGERPVNPVPEQAGKVL